MLVQYNLLTTSFVEVRSLIAQIASKNSTRNTDQLATKIHQIPVYYDVAVAADLANLCAQNNISKETLIEQHTSVNYDVYAIGFLPGFAYLGYVPDLISCPRHGSFRGTVPAGSVAIADRQTAIYPTDSPGGWQVIGRTPIALLKHQQSLLQVGDQVKFTSISQAEFLSLRGR